MIRNRQPHFRMPRPLLPWACASRSRARLQRLRIFDVEAVHRALDLPQQPAQHAARADFDKRRRALLDQFAHGLFPAHRQASPAAPALRAPRSPLVMMPASTLVTSGMRSGANGVARRSFSRRSCAGRISSLWNGAETGSITARLAPPAEACSTARFTAAAWPEMTVCSGEFRFAGRDHLAVGRFAADLRHLPGRAAPGSRPWRPRRQAPPPACTSRAAAPGARRRQTPARRPPPAPNTRPGCARPRNPAACLFLPARRRPRPKP